MIVWYTLSMKIQILVSLALLCSYGCMAPRLDTSSTRKMEKSMDVMRDKLSDEQNDKLDKAMMLIAFDTLEIDNIFKLNEVNTNNMLSKVKRKLANKTYWDIINIASRIAENKIKKLEQQKAIFATGLAQVEVSENSLFNRTDGSGFPRRILKFTVKNKGDQSYSKIYFNAKTFEKGRDIPFLNESFYYDIPGGLKPNETQTWELAPDTFINDAWNKDIPNGYLVVKATNAEDAQGKKIYDGEWSDSRQKELDELEDFLKD